MPVEFTTRSLDEVRPVWMIGGGLLHDSGLPKEAESWARKNGFSGQAGQVLTVPGVNGQIAGALLGTGNNRAGFASMITGVLAASLPSGNWYFANLQENAELSYLGLGLGGYRYTRYARSSGPALCFQVPTEQNASRLDTLIEGTYLVRDLTNAPTNIMGPQELEEATRKLADRFGAVVATISGDNLLTQNLPMIHAVGRAGAQAPRLIELSWGNPQDPKVTLVGKGVCFDTGGLDIKPASGMKLMKKDMGGAANVLGLALMIMAARMKLRLRVLVPAVENAISGNAFRPGDVLVSRKGPSVEIGNTDAEGRLVLADALALADEEAPELLVDMATLTGAARVALGPDIVPFYTGDDALASELGASSQAVADPLWRMPLWQPYAEGLDSPIADMNNVTSDGYAGSVTAALFLEKFVQLSKSWVHFDIFAWNPKARPHSPTGGEAQAIRALEHVLGLRFGK